MRDFGETGSCSMEKMLQHVTVIVPLALAANRASSSFGSLESEGGGFQIQSGIGNQNQSRVSRHEETEWRRK